MARGLGLKPLYAEVSGRGGTSIRAGSSAIRSPAARIQSVPPPPRPLRSGSPAPSRPLSDQSGLCPQLLGTSLNTSLRVSEVTHGDKETPGNGPGEVRTPPRLGDSGAPEVPFPALPRSLSHPHQHSDLFGWYKMFPRKPGHREVQDRASGPRPATRPPGSGAAARRWVGCASLPLSSGSSGLPRSSPTTAGRPRPSQR